MSPAGNHRPKIVVTAAFSIALTATSILAFGDPSWQAEPSPAELSKMRSYAESQHEIVMILMGKKEFSQALIEANKIFGLKWPISQESTLRKDLLYFADQFLHGGQAAMGVQILDTNLKIFKNNANRAAILKEKGYLHKNLGEGDKAIECFREAQRLEKTPN